jgi:hypothetical protein
MQGDELSTIVADYLRKVMELRELEADFLKVARRYSINHGITREAWLQFGVCVDVLDAAGVLDAGEGGSAGLRLVT